MKKFRVIPHLLSFTLLLGAPMLLVEAATVDSLLGSALGLVTGSLIPLVYTLAFFFFMYGLAKYVFSAGDDKAQVAGRQVMIWGTIALFVATSIWGLIQVLEVTLDIDGVSAGYKRPCIPFLGSGSNQCADSI